MHVLDDIQLNISFHHYSFLSITCLLTYCLGDLITEIIPRKEKKNLHPQKTVCFKFRKIPPL